MKRDIYELLRKRLMNINNISDYIDIIIYFSDIQFFNGESGDYKELFDFNGKGLKNLTLLDFTSLDDEKLSKKTGIDVRLIENYRKSIYSSVDRYYSMENYCDSINSFEKLVTDANLENYSEFFTNCILKRIKEDRVYFDAGIALFHNDNKVVETAKRYVRNRGQV